MANDNEGRVLGLETEGEGRGIAYIAMIPSRRQYVERCVPDDELIVDQLQLDDDDALFVAFLLTAEVAHMHHDSGECIVMVVPFGGLSEMEMRERVNASSDPLAQNARRTGP